MNWQFIRAIAEKDLAEVAKNRIAVMGAVVLSLVFAVGIPLLITQIAVLSRESDLSEFDTISAIVPAAQLAGLTPERLPIVLILGYLIAPLFLVLPLMLSCTIAAEAFVGEKERKTLEALLYTPATDAELFIGKALAALVPGIVFTWINFVIFAIVTNLAGYPVMGRIWFPTAELAGTHDRGRAGRCPARGLGNGDYLNKGQHLHGSLPGLRGARPPDCHAGSCPEHRTVISLAFSSRARWTGILCHRRHPYPYRDPALLPERVDREDMNMVHTFFTPAKQGGTGLYTGDRS